MNKRLQVLQEIEKKIPDFKKYFLKEEFDKMTAEDFLDRLEWEIDLIDNWKEEGFGSPRNISSMIDECGTRQARYLVKRIYKILKEVN